MDDGSDDSPTTGNVVHFHFDDDQVPKSPRGWDELHPATQARFISPTAICCYSDLDPHVHNQDKNNPCKFLQPLWAQPSGDYLLKQNRILQRSLARFGLGVINELVDMIMDYLSSESVCLHIGSLFDCLDQERRWSVAKIVGIDNERVKVHFLGWSENYDEWVCFDPSVRFAPLYTYTYPSVPLKFVDGFTWLDITTLPNVVDYAMEVIIFPRHIDIKIQIRPRVQWITADLFGLGVNKSTNELCCFIRWLDVNGGKTFTHELRGFEEIAWRIAPHGTFSRRK